MLIINADDFGRNVLATERILSCYKMGRINAASAMVFMEDSQRAAELAKEYCIDMGLHINFTQKLTQRVNNSLLYDYHGRIAGFLTKNKYNFLIYNPVLQKEFEYVFNAQFEEFEYIYGKSPSHIDGHHHMHLCANMIIKTIIPEGMRIRRNFTFLQGEKGLFNRAYRKMVDKWLSRKYRMTDYFFSLSDCIKKGRLSSVLQIAKNSTVELETHPEINDEYEWLMSDAFVEVVVNLNLVQNNF